MWVDNGNARTQAGELMELEDWESLVLKFAERFLGFQCSGTLVLIQQFN